MESLVLGKAVTVKGKDFWGREAVLKLKPSESPGWFIQYGSVIAPITLHKIFCKFRRLALKGGSYQLNCFEHLAPLRWLGLNNVLIAMSARMPYFTQPFDIWSQVKDHCKVDSDIPIQRISVQEEVKWWYPGKMRYTQINPGEDQSLKVKIICDYPNLGRKEEIFSLPPLNQKVLETPTQGWPPWLYYPSRAASFLGWPHHGHITWPQNHPKEEVLDRFIRHRLIDLLGALALIHPQRLLAGEIISNCSGHKGDIACARQARNNLIEL